MPSFRVDFRFSLFNQGWTEILYRTDANIGLATTAGISLMQGASLGFRDSHVVSEGIRVSQVLPRVPRITVRDPAAGNGGRMSSLASGAEDVVQTAVLSSLLAASGAQRSVLWRGLNDGDTIRDPDTGAFNPSPGLLAALGLMQRALQGGAWQIQTLDQSQPLVGLVSVTQDPTNPQLSLFTCQFAHTFVPGDVIYFRRIPLKDLPWLKGKWVVRTIPSATTFTVGYPFPLAGSYSFKLSSVRKVLYNYFNITSSPLEGLRSRKTGIGLRPTRGRARGIPFRR